MSQRDVIVVDTETSGLDPHRHAVVEVGWVDLATGQEGRFIPPHNVGEVLAHAEIEALRVNRYIDRIAGKLQDHDGGEAWALLERLDGDTLAGCNPAFDASFLRAMFRAYDNAMDWGVPTWHHRLLDLSAYAAGVLRLPLHDLPGLSRVCELLEVTNTAPHTALGDARATAECFRRLAAIDQKPDLILDPNNVWATDAEWPGDAPTETTTPMSDGTPAGDVS